MKHMNRKLLSVLLALLMVLSLVPTIFTPKAAVADAQPIDQPIVQGGAILHCYNWSYSEIEAHLDEIKAAGYVAVQTSPVQPPKDYSAAWNDTPGNWWKLYQPLDFSIAPDNNGIPSSWLGTKAELTSLCKAADQKGIYVIVDVVANHMANIERGGYKKNGVYNVSPQVAERLQDPDGSKNLYHTSEDYVNDDSRYNMTQYQMGMPDLNTGNQVVQDMVLDFLKECVDCGVDGFRFDAAKHIELPSDSGCGSNFWPYVLNGIRSYADENDNDLFIYGESLSGSGYDSWVAEYNTYMALTDSYVGEKVRDGIENVSDLDAGCVGYSYYSRGNNIKDYVIWVESHDTYEDGYYNASNNGGASRGISSDLIIRAWAIVGARADSTALYLARPNETMGLASTDISWKSPAVAAVNKFKAYYDGKGEYLHNDYYGKVAWIERGESGNAGVSISKLDGPGAVSLSVNLMSNGLYVDEISGSVFVVKDGTITGNVGPTGVAVIYKAAPYITTSPIYLVPGVWSVDNPKFLMYVFNSVDDNVEPTWTVMTHSDGDGTYEANLPAGNWNGLIFLRMSSSNNTSIDWKTVWNQTADLAPDPGCDTFTITGYGDPYSSGTWSASVSTENPNAGYYLVGTMNGWTINPAYKMTRTNASTEEYTIDVNLLRSGESDSKKFRCSQFKVVYSSDGITKDQWYPDGFDNNYGDYYNYNTKTGEIPVSGYYTVYFRPNGDGNSDWHDSCIYATQSKYYVKIDDRDNNGVVTVNKTIADMDDAITVTVTPHEGYELDTLTYSYETGTNPITTVTNDVEDGSFTMPAFNVTVKATFKEAAAAEPSFETQSLVLDGQIGVKFYMNLDCLTEEEKAASYMTFTISGKGTVPSDPVYYNANNRNRSRTLYAFACYVNAIQMADTITATFHYGNGQTIEKQYSIMQYYEAFKGHAGEYSEQTRNLVRALVCYGYCTQQYLMEAKNLPLGYDEASYAPIELPEELEEMVDSYEYANIVYMIEEDSLLFIINSMSDENIKGISFMLALDSETKMRVTFKPDPSYTGIATCRSDNANEAEMQKVGGRFVAEVPNIPAHKLGEMHRIWAYTGDNCYSQIASTYTEIDASPMSYVYLMLTRTGATENEKNCGAAIYTYWKAAQAYIGE